MSRDCEDQSDLKITLVDSTVHQCRTLGSATSLCFSFTFTEQFVVEELIGFPWKKCQTTTSQLKQSYSRVISQVGSDILGSEYLFVFLVNSHSSFLCIFRIHWKLIVKKSPAPALTIPVIILSDVLLAIHGNEQRRTAGCNLPW